MKTWKTINGLSIWIAAILCFALNALGDKGARRENLKRVVKDLIADETLTGKLKDFNTVDLIEQYDLIGSADKTIERVYKEGKLKEYLETRQITMDGFREMERGERAKYILGMLKDQKDVLPEVKAWIKLRLGVIAALNHVSLDPVFEGLHELRTLPPMDFMPNHFVATWAKRLDLDTLSESELETCVGALVKAMELSSTHEEKIRSLIDATHYAAQFKKMGAIKGENWIRHIWRRAQTVVLQDVNPKDPDARLLDAIKMVLAMAVEDLDACSELAGSSGSRHLKPIFMIFKEERSLAYETFHQLQASPDLSLFESNGLAKLKPIVYMFTGHLREAQKAIDAERKDNGPSGEQIKWLDEMQKMLDERLESGAVPGRE